MMDDPTKTTPTPAAIKTEQNRTFEPTKHERTTDQSTIYW